MSIDVGVGIAAGALIGAAAVAGAYGYSSDPIFPCCHPIPLYDAYGNYVGGIRVCNAAPYE